MNQQLSKIAEEELRFIFDSFWHKEKSHTRASGRWGLRLAIATQLTRAHREARTV